MSESPLPAEAVRAAAEAALLNTSCYCLDDRDSFRTSVEAHTACFGCEAAAVLAALAEQGYILVARHDLAETVEDAHCFNDTMLGGDDATTARLDRLRAALSGTLHPPQGSESVSAPPATPGHADTPENPSSTRTSPHMSDTDHTRNPRNEDN